MKEKEIGKCIFFFCEWTKCTHTTADAPRLKAQWKLPEENDNEYLDEVRDAPFYCCLAS